MIQVVLFREAAIVTDMRLGKRLSRNRAIALCWAGVSAGTSGCWGGISQVIEKRPESLYVVRGEPRDIPKHSI